MGSLLFWYAKVGTVAWLRFVEKNQKYMPIAHCAISSPSQSQEATESNRNIADIYMCVPSFFVVLGCLNSAQNAGECFGFLVFMQPMCVLAQKQNIYKGRNCKKCMEKCAPASKSFQLRHEIHI